MEIKQSEKEITISQEALLEKYGMSDCKPVVIFIIPRQDKESDPFDNVIQSKDYQEIISELLYLNNRCRPDIRNELLITI